jgi:hypothetical protein
MDDRAVSALETDMTKAKTLQGFENVEHRKINWSESEPFGRKSVRTREEQGLKLVDRAGFGPAFHSALLRYSKPVPHLIGLDFPDIRCHYIFTVL